MIREFKRLSFLMTDKHQSKPWSISLKVQNGAEVAKQLLMALRSRDYWYLENFIQRLIKDFFIKTSEKINHNKTVKKFTKRVFKTQDPVFQRYDGSGLFYRSSIKSAGWMPWHWEPMKDVISCEKLRGGANIHWSGDIRMGKPTWANLKYPYANP